MGRLCSGEAGDKPVIEHATTPYGGGTGLARSDHRAATAVINGTT
jgi:hypothetical protein